MENEIKKLMDKWDRQRYMFNQAWENACEEIIKDLGSLLKSNQKNCHDNTTIDNKSLIVSFVQGAAWWEYHETGSSMWQSHQHLADEEANRMLANNTLGKTVDDIIEEKNK